MMPEKMILNSKKCVRPRHGPARPIASIRIPYHTRARAMARASGVSFFGFHQKVEAKNMDLSNYFLGSNASMDAVRL